MKIFWILLLFTSFSVIPVFAETLLTTQKTTLIKRENGKLKKWAEVRAKEILNFRKSVGDGKWLEAIYQGNTVYVKASATNYKTDRDPSSHSESGFNKSEVKLKAGAELSYGTNSLGVGLGARFTAEIPYFKSPEHRLEAMGLFTLYPSLGGLDRFNASGRSILFGGFGRYGYAIKDSIHVGGELGAAFMSTSVSVSNYSGGSSGLLLGLGGFGEGKILPNLSWLSGLRLFVADGSFISLFGGVQYHF